MSGFRLPSSPRYRIGFVLAILLTSVAGPRALFAQAPSGYRVMVADSYLLATLDRSGIFGFASHRHAILAREWTADLRIDPNALADTTGSIVIPAKTLVVDTAEARKLAAQDKGPKPEDVVKIQERMLGPEVLDVDQYREIRFTIASIQARGPNEFLVGGTFHLHGRSKEITVPVRSKPHNTGGFVFEGSFPLKQTDFGMTPVTVAGGTVRVKDEMKISFRISVAPK